MNKRKFFTTCAVIAVSLAPVSASAEDWYPGHYSVSGHQFVDMLTAEQKLELHEYLNYEEREPCQNYQEVPDGFYMDGCHLRYRYPEKKVAKAIVTPAPEPKKAKVLNSYKVYFDFDKSNIKADAARVLDRVAGEIKSYNPSEVTVAGHADRAGSSDYNIGLSQRRADAVSDALTGRGVTNRVIKERAYGESQPAVETEDGVRLQENRRVTIDFLK